MRKRERVKDDSKLTVLRDRKNDTVVNSDPEEGSGGKIGKFHFGQAKLKLSGRHPEGNGETAEMWL